MKKGIELFYQCGCNVGDYHHSTDECDFCKGTGKLLTDAGKFLMEIVVYHEQQKLFDKKKEDALREKIHEDALNHSYSWGDY